MSAPSESAASPLPCACTNITLMQLFHELKQKFPGVPDHVVSNTIELYCHDKQACETHLHREVKASLTHAYHASSSAAARQLNEIKVNAPLKCRNQPIVKHDSLKAIAINTVTCQGPQTAIVSSLDEDTEQSKIKTDANQNVLLGVTYDDDKTNKSFASPVAVINIDNCFAKYSTDSPSDLELSNDDSKENISKEKSANTKAVIGGTESTNYRILKSNKVKHNLNEKLEKGKQKKTLKKEEVKELPSQEKPKRPNTLDFIKPNPDIAFKQTLSELEFQGNQSVSPATSHKQNAQTTKETLPGGLSRSERVPFNVSVNVNCHMDLSRPYGDPWLEDYDSPRTITSVNLTVCTPTSNMASPVRDLRDSREEDGGFEGHVTVTVSPSTVRAPLRRAPPPPQYSSHLESPRPTRGASDPPLQTQDCSLIDRQKERLGRLAKALAQEKEQLAQLTRETQILAAPPPTLSATQKLKEYVEKLRDQCDSLAKRLEMSPREPEDSGNFYSNIYTGQRPTASWQCHMCTFRNHPLLDKCEECDMPRIFVGTSLTRTHDSGFGSFRDRDRKNSTQSNNAVYEMNETSLYVSDLKDDLIAISNTNC